MAELHSSLARLVFDVRVAAGADAWHAALALSLALPDICAKATPTRMHYTEWFDRYVAPELKVPWGLFPDDPASYSAMTGHDAYALRNAVLHSGDDDLSTYRKASEAFLESIILTQSRTVGGPGVRKLRIPMGDRKAQFALPVGHLCDFICRGVRKWAEEFQDDPSVRARLDRIVTIKPPGTDLEI